MATHSWALARWQTLLLPLSCRPSPPTPGPVATLLTSLTSPPLPAPRSAVAMSDVGPSQMLVFGGKEPVSPGDTDGHFREGLLLLDYENIRWEHPASKGTPPAARVSHCACVDRDSHFYVFGGRTENDKGESELQNDLWCLTYGGTTETWSWQQVTASGAPPSPRWGAAICSE